ncbi:ABC transporter permease [bacterium]|nr:ABC transporter permease [bacterium]
MIALEIFREALSSLWQNKGRTFLSVLGIVIGIASVIVMMGIGQGAQDSITSEVGGLGTSTINLINMSREKPLTLKDLDAILANDYAGVFSAYCAQTQGSYTLAAGSESVESVSVTGVTAGYLTVEGKTVELGNFFDDDDFATGNRVIAVGQAVAKDIYGSASAAIGQRLNVGTIPFTIVAVFASESSSGMSFSDPDSFAVVPLSAMQNSLTGSSSLGSISFLLTDAAQATTAKSIIGYTMLARHNLTDVADADFTIFAATDLLEVLTAVTGTMTMLLSGIAGISLVVGGIGIMNVMLMSVMERTREIGLRKALGARQITLIAQFLFEAVLITCLGGIIGLLIGLGGCTAYSFIMTQMSNDARAVVSWSSVILSIGISTAIGLIFGIYPARKAAKLPPIEALRTE